MLGERIDDNEIVRHVRLVRLGSARGRCARRIPSINAIAVQAGLSRKHLYDIANTGRLGNVARQKLTCYMIELFRSRARTPSDEPK
jgi:hypothetical protein